MCHFQREKHVFIKLHYSLKLKGVFCSSLSLLLCVCMCVFVCACMRRFVSAVAPGKARVQLEFHNLTSHVNRSGLRRLQLLYNTQSFLPSVLLDLPDSISSVVREVRSSYVSNIQQVKLHFNLHLDDL